MPYDRKQMRAVFWRATGRQPEAQLSNLVIDGYLDSAAVIVAQELELPERTDSTLLALEAGIYSYPLPSNILGIKEVSWDGKPVSFASLDEWRSNNKEFRNSTANNPEYVAVEARTLYIYPKPSADAITTDPALLLRVTMASEGVTESGIPGMSDADVLLVCYFAALEYMGFNNGDGRFNNSLKSATAFYEMQLTRAKIRYAEMLQGNNPTMNVMTGRVGPSR